MKTVTLEAIYKKVVDLQRDMVRLREVIMEEPELRADFIARMKDIDQEKSIMIDNFGKRYNLK